MALLNLSRTQIYELIRTSRLVTVTQGRRRLVPADSITDYVQLLLAEYAGRRAWPRGVATAKAASAGTEARQRWVGRASLGYNADGKRRIGTVSARTKTEAKNKLRALLRDHDDGLPTQQRLHRRRRC